MLAQVTRAAKSGDPIVFFGWRPHPMNVNLDMAYLTDGDDVFGPNDGAAEVLTNTRPGYVEECPNVGQFLKNLEFKVEAEDLMMSYVLDDGMSADEAAEKWLKPGQPGRARRLARRRDDARRPAGRRGGASGARALSRPARGGGRQGPYSRRKARAKAELEAKPVRSATSAMGQTGVEDEPAAALSRSAR